MPVKALMLSLKTIVMHRYEILPIIRLADIVFHLLADTDNRSNYKYLQASCNFSIYFLKFCLIFL